MTVTKNKIRAVLFDIDGVITDGKKYTDGISKEIKSVSYKDLDAIKSLQDDGILVGCISGEDTPFSRNLAESLDFYSLGVPSATSRHGITMWCRTRSFGTDAANGIQQSTGRSVHPGH